MKEIVYTAKNAKPVGPYSQATKFANVCYTSGQLPIDPRTGTIELNDIKRATELCLDAIVNICQEIEAKPTDIIKCTIYLRDIEDYHLVNDTYAKYFLTEPPARTAFEVANLPFKAPIEIEAIIGCDQ